jgi:tRNA (cytidine32/guanosine34-2'-O)-methyltransferase
MGKIAKDKRDIYYRLAKQMGYRSRSAFKIIQIDDYFEIFANTKYIVDLCSAPGGWSQIAATKVKDSKIISIDLQEMAPIDGVDIILGDITSQQTLNKILAQAEGNLIDLVMCDGAPDVTGFNEFDVYIQSQLVLASLNISLRMLKGGGTFISKLFKGKHTNKILQILKKFFNKVTIAKPRACRNASFESFVVCQDFYVNIEDDVVSSLRQGELKEGDLIILNSLWSETEVDLDLLGIKLIQVGKEEYDSDKTYDLECTDYKNIIKPVQKPINPPYKFYIDNYKGKI